MAKRPKIVEDRHLVYLDAVRESGVTNMFGASSHIQTRFGLPYKDARDVLVYWMRTFGKENR
jgi:hypothetical protein